MNIYSFSEYQLRISKLLTIHGFNIMELSNQSLIASINQTSNQRLAIISGLHGDEKAGPLAILSWLEEIPLDFFIHQKRGLWIAPLLNNLGWEQDQREWKELDLNRSFRQNAPSFLRKVMFEINNFSPTIFLDLHEDSSVDNAYLFQLVGKRSQIGENLKKILNARAEPWEKDDPQWFGASEIFVRENGCEDSFTLETPGNWTLSDRISLHKKVISWCFLNANKS